jgi:DNA-binding response OmpR family regulator
MIIEWPYADRSARRPLAMPAAAAVRSMRCRRVLLVEGHAEVRAMLARALRHAGFEVYEAAAAPAARSLLLAMPFEAVVIDTPLASAAEGFELGEWVRGRFTDMRLVFTTGLHEWHPRAARNRDTHVLFVRKPFGARIIVDFVLGLSAPPIRA